MKYLDFEASSNLFSDNYKAFRTKWDTALESTDQKTDLNKLFLEIVRSIRVDTYKSTNNFTAFPKESFQKLAEKHNLQFDNPSDTFFDIAKTPPELTSIEREIFGPQKFVENHFFDTMHNIMNMVNMHMDRV